MKKILLTAAVLSTTLALAQDMKPSGKKPVVTPLTKELTKVLAEDMTSEIPYQTGKFTCHNFAKTLYLQRSSLVGDLTPYNIDKIPAEWGNTIDRKPETIKLPIYMVTIFNVDSGFYHAINALLVKPEAPNQIESYVFLEPQTDEIFSSPKSMYNHYAHYLNKTEAGKVMEVNIGTFDEFKFNGYIYQSFDSTKASFKLF